MEHYATVRNEEQLYELTGMIPVVNCYMKKARY